MKYLVKDSQDNLVMIGATGFTPQGVVAPVPKELEEEDASWLKVVELKDSETDETTTVVQVDEDLKAQILSERAQKETEAKARETTRRQEMGAAKDRLKNVSKMNTVAQLRGAVLDIMKVLGMEEGPSEPRE